MREARSSSLRKARRGSVEKVVSLEHFEFIGELGSGKDKLL
jgi:hypothetical protein